MCISVFARNRAEGLDPRLISVVPRPILAGGIRASPLPPSLRLIWLENDIVKHEVGSRE